MGKWGTGLIKRNCERCDKEFHARHDRLGKFCSRSCTSKKPGKSFKVKKKCVICEKEYVVKRYQAEITKCCSTECRRTYTGLCVKGNRHPKWNGGISERPHWTRKAIKELRKEIKECQKCSSTEKLQGHHILSYANHPELVNEKTNIIILCVQCHAKEYQKLANLILKGGVYG